MNRAELIEELASRFEGNRKQATLALESVLDVVTRAVATGERVAISGFGVFEKVDRPARTARNPRTGESVRVKKTSVPRFKAGQGFKDVVSGAKKMPKIAAAATRGAATAAKRAAANDGRAGSKTAAATSKKSTGTKSTARKAPAKSAAKKSTAKKSSAPRATRKATASRRSAR